MDRLRYISRPLSTSLYRSSKYRWGEHDLALPKMPKQGRAGQNIIRVEGNHRLKLESIAVKQKRYLERGAAQDYSAEMTVSPSIVTLYHFLSEFRIKFRTGYLGRIWNHCNGWISIDSCSNECNALGTQSTIQQI